MGFLFFSPLFFSFVEQLLSVEDLERIGSIHCIEIPFPQAKGSRTCQHAILLLSFHCPKLIRGTRLPIFKKKETVIISHWRASNRLDDYLRIIYVICPRSSNRAKGWCQNGSRENRHWIGLGKKGNYFSDLSGFWREWGGCGGNTSSKLLIFHQNLVGCIGPQFRFGLNSFIQINA